MPAVTFDQQPVFKSSVLPVHVLKVAGARPQEYANSTRKRTLDLVLGTMLLVLLSPLLCAISLLIAVTGDGPVLYRQTRYGKEKRTFEIIKFRTMVCHPENRQVEQAYRGDPRVTSIGQVLRKTSLDELPQLINVIKGEMTLVGPRPHPVSLDDRFAGEIRRFDERFLVSPGITGLAQVNGARGETATVDAMSRRVAFDIQYIETASFGGDIAILIRTFKEIAWSKAAY